MRHKYTIEFETIAGSDVQADYLLHTLRMTLKTTPLEWVTIRISADGRPETLNYDSRPQTTE